MAKTLLFKSWRTKNSILPDLINQAKSRNDDINAISKYSDSKSATLHMSIIKAVLASLHCDEHEAAWEALKAQFPATPFDSYGALIKWGTNLYASETKLADGSTQIITYNAGNGDIEGCICKSRIAPIDGVDKTTTSLSGIFIALFHALVQDGEYANELEKLARQISVDFNSDAMTCMYRLCDNVYRRIESLRAGDDGYLPCRIPQDGNIQLLTQTTLNSIVKNGADVFFGEPDVLAGNSAVVTSARKKQKEAQTVGGARKLYAASTAWNEREKNLIRAFANDFPVPSEVSEIARYYSASSNDKTPMRDFMWRGITGYGKSMGVEILSCILQRPLVRLTCFPDMETQNFLSDFVPDTSSAHAAVSLSFEEIENDPAGAYERITGLYCEDMTPQQVLSAYVDGRGTNNAPRFKHVVSPYVEALTNGWIIEIQEASLISKPGVLAGLNEFDRPGAQIPLLDGTYGVRHKDAIVVYTDNISYASCRPLNESVLRRNAFVLDSYEMPQKDIKARVKYLSELQDVNLLDKMYEVWEALQNFVEEQEITGGCVSIVELTNWAQAVRIGGEDSVKQNCIRCVVAKASADREEQKSIIAAVVDPRLD